ncbi:MAG: hypothetical protein AB1555_06050 [Nitrospirota bacterium]
MKMLIIVARDSMLEELEALLHDTGVKTYTVLSNVKGEGLTGKVYGTFLQPDINCIIFSALPSDQANSAVKALQAHYAARVKAARGQPIPVKVFTFPCEEHV